MGKEHTTICVKNLVNNYQLSKFFAKIFKPRPKFARSASSTSALAHLLAETNARLVAVGLSDGRNFDFPLTQFDVAEICGMTAIHVNRVLRQLRERNLCTLRNGRVEIHDLAGLTRLGEFEPGYLYLSGEIASRVMG